MQSTLVRAACDHRTIRIRLRNWFNKGYRLVAVSTTPTFNYSEFTINEIVESVERGITVHLASEKDRNSIAISRNTDGLSVQGHEPLVFGYVVKSHTSMKPSSRVNPSRITTGLRDY